MRKAKIAILILILLIGGVVIFTLFSSLQEKKVKEVKDEPSKTLNEPADMRLEKIRLVEDKHGRKTWELEAKSIQQYEDENVMVVEEVKVTFYGKDGSSYILSGDQGKVYQNSKNIELKGDVVLSSSEGYWLRTQSVAYNHQKKKATTPDPVKIEGEQVWLEGVGMEVDMEAQTFKILHQVKTRWKGAGKG